ncbi:TIR domain-containing protein, partial [Bacillus velezensis]|uniref:TIR domain-containing protein n=1 Tax=Bacillus velezensis TaxID=492670 RepID=UPI0031771D25
VRYLKELPYLEVVPPLKETEKNSTITFSVDQNKEFEKKIFISHSSKDKTVCDAFVDLLEGIGVPSEDIIYTSSPYHGIPGDDNIFDYLRKHLFKGAYVCYMLSDNYYDSVYCLNEMGATWVNSNNSSTFKLPGFEGEIKGVIDKNKKAYSLEEPLEVYDFKEKILRMYDLTLDPKKWERIKSSFYENLK